jgi:hypothetical protein
MCKYIHKYKETRERNKLNNKSCKEETTIGEWGEGRWVNTWLVGKKVKV